MQRIAVYTDYTYRRVGDAIFSERAFVLFLLALAPHLRALTIVGKVNPRAGRAHYELSADVSFVELPFFASLTQPAAAVRAMLGSLHRFWRLLDDVDGVWLLGPHPLAIAFAGLARVRGRAVTLGVRQDFPRYVRARHPQRRVVWIAGDLLEAAWRGLARRQPVVAVGPELAAGYPGAEVLEITVSLVGESDIVRDDHARSTVEDGELRLLSVGRLEQEKNPLLLVDILAALHHRDPRWRLIICGEGPLEPDVRARVRQLGVGDRVELRGYVAHDALREIYRSSDVLLHVSFTEGLPQVLFEAFAARLPVVATAVGGVPAAAGEAAVLIESGSADAAVDAVLRLRADSVLRDRLVEAGTRLVSARTMRAEAGRVAGLLNREPGRRS